MLKMFTILNLSQQEKSPLRNCVLRLGVFHTLMSFLGVIRHFMSGSGIEEALQEIYAPNNVVNMLLGKSVSRVIRGHSLTQLAVINDHILDLNDSEAMDNAFENV